MYESILTIVSFLSLLLLVRLDFLYFLFTQERDFFGQIASGLGREGFPRSLQFEFPELLRHLQWLDHHTFHLIVIATFGVAGEGEILSERVPLEAIIGKNTP